MQFGSATVTAAAHLLLLLQLQAASTLAGVIETGPNTAGPAVKAIDVASGILCQHANGDVVVDIRRNDWLAELKDKPHQDPKTTNACFPSTGEASFVQPILDGGTWYKDYTFKNVKVSLWAHQGVGVYICSFAWVGRVEPATTCIIQSTV